MDFALDEHQLDVQRRARAFAETEVAPVASTLDRAGSIPPTSSMARPRPACSEASRISSPMSPA